MTDTAIVDAHALSIGSRLSPAGGVAITGPDLSAPCRSTSKKAILAAFLEHHVLVFRDQHLSKDEQLAFTRQFGEIEEHVARHSAGMSDTASCIWSPTSARTACRPPG